MEEERHLTAGEERAEARARVMMAASRLQPSVFDLKLNGERSTSVMSRGTRGFSPRRGRGC